MMNLQHILKTLVFSSVLLAATACESIFEGAQDCTTKIKFEFRKNRQALQAVNGKSTDAFEASVSTVHLFIYNAENGKLVFQQFANTDDLSTETDLGIGSGSTKSYIAVDLPAGTYSIIAWCGLDENDENNAFALAQTSRAATTYDHCAVKLAEPATPLHDEKYQALYHGAATQIELHSNGETVPIQLTKNTNDIAVMVQHLTTTLVTDDYEVVYTDANGTMDFADNSVDNSQVLEYFPHTKYVITTDQTEFNGSTAETGAVIAHISTARLLENNAETARLEVRNRKGETIFSIPLIQYLLRMQTFTNDGQYYLDCEDTYNCSFYLTGDYERWQPAQIIINNWVIVPDQAGNI